MTDSNRTMEPPHPEKIVFAICGDMHLGDGSSRDDFTPALEDKILAELRIILGWRAARKTLLDLEGKDEGGLDIVLNGDVADIWRFKWCDIMARWGGLLARLGEVGAWWIIGNHDEGLVVDGLLEECPRGLLFAQRLMIQDLFLPRGAYICHGQEFDLVNGRWSGVGRGLTTVGSWLGRLSAVLEDKAASAAGKVESSGRNSNHNEFASRALDFIEMFPRARTVVCSHTHAEDYQIRDRIGRGGHGPCSYINTGKYANSGWLLLYEDGQFRRWSL